MVRVSAPYKWLLTGGNNKSNPLQFALTSSAAACRCCTVSLPLPLLTSGVHAAPSFPFGRDWTADHRVTFLMLLWAACCVQ